MSKKRLIDTRFWEDGFIINLTPDEKALFLYFLTSPMSNICGIYECPLKLMAAHTGLDRDILPALIGRFEGKVHYIDGWVYVRNFIKHQSSKSPTIIKGIEEELSKIPDKIKKKIKDIEECHGDDEGLKFTNDITESSVKEKNENQIDFDKFVNEFHLKINPKSRFTPGAKKKLEVRLAEFSIEDLIDAINRFSKDDWRMKNNRSMGMEWFLRSNSQVNKWLELEGGQKRKLIQV